MARVVSTESEFTSALWPFTAQGRGIDVRLGAPAELASAIDSRTDPVAFGAVQSSNGELTDLDAVAAAARRHGALSQIDATPACGWSPLADARRLAAARAGLLRVSWHAYRDDVDRALDLLRPGAAPRPGRGSGAA